MLEKTQPTDPLPIPGDIGSPKGSGNMSKYFCVEPVWIYRPLLLARFLEAHCTIEYDTVPVL